MSTDRCPHIVLVTPGFPENEADTSCIPALQIFCKWLHHSEKVHLSIVTLEYPYRKTPYTWHGINVFPCHRGRGKMHYLGRIFAAERTIMRLHQAHGIDLLHCCWLDQPSLVGLWFRWRSDIPFLVTLMGQDVRERNGYLRLVSYGMKWIVAISAWQADIFRQNTKREVTEVIPWGIDPVEGNIHDSDQVRPWDVIGVGNLIPLKNYIEFVQIIQGIRKQNPGIRALIIGDGIERNRIHQKIISLNLEEHLVLMGKLSREEVLVQMSKAKILLHTSTFEGQGYVFYEALALGCKIVSYKVGAAVASPSWIVCRDQDEMIVAISNELNAWHAPALVNVPSVDDTVERYLDIYHQILQESGS